MGNTHLNNLLLTTNIPTMNHCLFKRREREVRKAVEIVARESCEMNLNLEKKVSEQLSGPSTDGLAGIAVSYDMGWQKRGRGHNSSTGHGAAMGLTTGKVVSYSTRCKACRVCNHNEVTVLPTDNKTTINTRHFKYCICRSTKLVQSIPSYFFNNNLV